VPHGQQIGAVQAVGAQLVPRPHLERAGVGDEVGLVGDGRQVLERPDYRWPGAVCSGVGFGFYGSRSREGQTGLFYCDACPHRTAWGYWGSGSARARCRAARTGPETGIAAGMSDPDQPPTRPSGLHRISQRYAERLDPTVIGRFWSRLLEVEFVDRSVALAAKLLVSLFPLLIVVVALSPAAVREAVFETLVTRFGLDGGPVDLVRHAFAAPAETRTATGVVGVLITIFYATSFTTALQRTYLRAWRRPSGGGLGNKRRGAAWVGGVVVMLLALSALHSVFHGPVGSWALRGFGLALSILLWWWTAHLLLRGEVAWRALLVSGIVTGLGAWVYTGVASIWFPPMLAQNYAQFGAFGLSLAFVTWFTGFAFLIVGAAVLGPALAEGDDRIARWVNPTGRYLTPGAPAPLPGPSRPLRLSDAFARGRGRDASARDN
jgi:membrane protein